MKPQDEVSNNCQTKDSMWDKAISDAENEIDSLAKQAKRLKVAIQTFRANKKDGISWPVTNTKSIE
jgi:hypothetical protein